MTNIDTYIKALQIKWILRLLENSNENWKIIPPMYFENIGENILILNLPIILYSEIRPYSSKIALIKMIPLFIQLTFTKH
jgi:hypothetical protein